MSGTSLDGLDLAFCRFEYTAKKWRFNIIKATTVPYPVRWKIKLSEAGNLSANEFSSLNAEFGIYIGKTVRSFIKKNNLKADFIGCHGHTVFHQPEHRFTVQIGSGAHIAAESAYPCICDFRTTDVALGGQGAPLVPIGDELLFGNYDFCLNIGGFANISYRQSNKRIAFDICPANIILNHLAAKLNKDYDASGNMAKKGNDMQDLLFKLNHLPYYSLNPPKSLGREWLEDMVIPLTAPYKKNQINDLLRTFTEHIAVQISNVINKTKGNNVLVTGGGAFNDFLIGLIRQKCKAKLVLPENDIINYKEALIFAFLGVLRMRNTNNCIRSVTGALRDCCGGAIYLP